MTTILLVAAVVAPIAAMLFLLIRAMIREFERSESPSVPIVPGRVPLVPAPPVSPGSRQMCEADIGKHALKWGEHVLFLQPMHKKGGFQK